MPSPLVKICGITKLEDALFCSSAGANFLGFIFYTKSPRYITHRHVREIIEQLPSTVTPVGVFVNESREVINDIILKTNIRIIQLSGDESPDDCLGYPIDVWKAFRIDKIDEVQQTTAFQISAALLDGVKGKEYGGTGVPADISVANEIKKYHRLVLAGGLNPENVSSMIRQTQPYAIDVNSGVEISPGKKDHNKVKQLFENISKNRI